MSCAYADLFSTYIWELSCEIQRTRVLVTKFIPLSEHIFNANHLDHLLYHKVRFVFLQSLALIGNKTSVSEKYDPYNWFTLLDRRIYVSRHLGEEAHIVVYIFRGTNSAYWTIDCRVNWSEQTSRESLLGMRWLTITSMVISKRSLVSREADSPPQWDCSW